MSLFSSTDLSPLGNGHSFPDAVGVSVELEDPIFLSGDKLSVISQAIGNLNYHSTIFFMTDGAWSNIELLEYILNFTGPAALYFTTWSIASDTITRLHSWQEKGLILDSFVILDQGIRNRKPEILQQASAVFKNLKLTKCHAKVTVIKNERFSITLMGSANFTRNPRIETGMIIQSRALAEENIKWILEEFL